MAIFSAFWNNISITLYDNYNFSQTYIGFFSLTGIAGASAAMLANNILKKINYKNNILFLLMFLSFSILIFDRQGVHWPRQIQNRHFVGIVTPNLGYLFRQIEISLVRIRRQSMDIPDVHLSHSKLRRRCALTTKTGGPILCVLRYSILNPAPPMSSLRVSRVWW